MSLEHTLSSAQQRMFPNEPLLQPDGPSMITSELYMAQVDRAERESKGRICFTIGNRVRLSWTNPNLPLPVELTPSVALIPSSPASKAASPNFDHRWTILVLTRSIEAYNAMDGKK
ncbi:uncharacterized protein UTRI_10054 [Ustilago trichophora]|uniref:Uncharacterized protein n=1 Tax=Ustilago trichophora TaxID=86804 RepID=A0A5C3DTM8_9BASI|nr:uncharacterized protein UTRI_10054 [Ustilago trichophora]